MAGFRTLSAGFPRSLADTRALLAEFPQKSADVSESLAGLQNNATQVAKRGLDAAYLEKLQADLAKAIAENNEQEKLKADLKQKTAMLESTLKQLNAEVAEARKIVKIDFPQPQWREFGIEAKR